MHIGVVAVGRLKERFWADAQAEYLKRLGPYADVHVVEVPDKDSGRGGIDRALAEEGDAILRALAGSTYVVALDIQGRQLSSEQFAELFDSLALNGTSAVTFVTGGSHGLSRAVLDRADVRLSFGPMTLPHNLARIVLLEQVYRAFRILRGQPYHK